jgi:hypothetical protein
MPTITNKKLINFPLLVNIFIAVIFTGLVGSAFLYLFITQVRQTVSVIGTSSSVLTNQIASYSVSIESVNADKVVAVQEVTDKSKEIIQMLKEFGVAEADIETTNLNIYQRQDPVYQGGTTTYELSDWSASYTVNAKLRDLSRSDEFTALLASIDKASMWGPNLTIDQSSVNEEELLKLAIEDARKKAESIASEVGKKVGKATRINEGGVSGVYPEAYRLDGMGGGGGMPIEPGSTQTYKTVVVTFELK